MHKMHSQKDVQLLSTAAGKCCVPYLIDFHITQRREFPKQLIDQAEN